MNQYRTRYLFSFVLSVFTLALTVQAGKLDIEARDLTGQDVKKLGGMVQSGVLVTKSTGNAKAAGILDGDVIERINEHSIHGVYEMQEALKVAKGKKMSVHVLRVKSEGLLRLERLAYDVEMAVDLQIKKSFVLDLGYPSKVKVGQFRQQSLLLWHANKVWVYDKKVDRERFVSLLKVYNMKDHKTYRYIVPQKVLESYFLTDSGLLLYVSKTLSKTIIGTIDMTRNDSWKYEIDNLIDQSYNIKLHDINGDRVPEIFISYQVNEETGTRAQVFCLDGSTGNRIWNRNDLTAYLTGRDKESSNYSDIYIADFKQDGAAQVSVGLITLNAATGRNLDPLTFDPSLERGGLIETRQLIGDPLPDILSMDGLIDGNSAETVWEPLRSREYFFADLNGDQREEIVYLLNDKKLHVHEIDTHRELYSYEIEGTENLLLADLNNDGFSDLISREHDKVYLFQTNIPSSSQNELSRLASIGHTGPLLDFGMRKEKFFFYARDLYQKGKLKESIPLFNRSLASLSGDSRYKARIRDILRYLSAAYVNTGDFEGALTLLREDGEETYVREVLKQFSSEIIAYLLDRGYTQRAIQFLEMRKDEDPVLLSRCYLAVGNPQAAVSIIERMEIQPDEALLILGKAQVLLGQNDQAKASLSNYLTNYDDSVEGWKELGELEAFTKNWDAAYRAYKKVLELDPVEGHSGLSRYYLFEAPHKNISKAEEHAFSAFQIEKSDRTRLQLAIVRAEQGQYEQAQAQLEAIQDPGLSAKRFEHLKDRVAYQLKAKSIFEEAEKLLVYKVFNQKNQHKAKSNLEEVIQAYPESDFVDDAHFRLAEYHLNLGNREDALYHFTEVAKGDGELSKMAKIQAAKLQGPAPLNSAPQDPKTIDLQLQKKDQPKTQDSQQNFEKSRESFLKRIFRRKKASAPKATERRTREAQPSMKKGVPFPLLKTGEELEQEKVPVPKDAKTFTAPFSMSPAAR